MPHIDIIIVNWNAGDQLRCCLASIATHGCGVVGKLVVVDNGSSDGSLKSIDDLSLPLEIICNRENRGFAAACNQGAALCTAKYLLFLNPDTELFADSLAIPLAFMESPANSRVGICGIQLVEKDGAIARTCARFPSFGRLLAESTGINRIPLFAATGMHMKDWDHAASHMVDQVIGAFFLVRRSLFQDLSNFDERFFVYFEEVDFSFRAWKDGWYSWYLTDAQAFHEGGGTSRQVKARRLFYSLRSRLLYAFKHLPAWQAKRVLFCTLVVEPFMRTGFSLMKGDLNGAVNILRAYGSLFAELGNITSSKGRSRV